MIVYCLGLGSQQKNVYVADRLPTRPARLLSRVTTRTDPHTAKTTFVGLTMMYVM